MDSEVASALPGFGAAHSLPKIPTGIGGFDNITFGGLPKRRPTAGRGGPGCGKTLFAMTFRVNGTPCCNEPAREQEELVAFLGLSEEYATSFGRDRETIRASRGTAA